MLGVVVVDAEVVHPSLEFHEFGLGPMIPQLRTLSTSFTKSFEPSSEMELEADRRVLLEAQACVEGCTPTIHGYTLGRDHLPPVELDTRLAFQRRLSPDLDIGIVRRAPQPLMERQASLYTGAVSIAADLTGDGYLELISGRHAWSVDWQVSGIGQPKVSLSLL